MNTSGNIFLIGPMGAGKTTIGRELAKVLKMEFRDSDREIERRTGATIPLIFELEGETGFRRREAVVINEMTQGCGVVLATGGGAILDNGNRAKLAARGCVIYLQGSLEQLLKRTAKDQHRPLLQTENPRQRLQELMRVRDPLYREIADFIIETDGRSVRSVVNDLVRQIET